MKPVVDYFIEYCHPTSPKIWNRSWDYYNTIQDAKARIVHFKDIDWMRECECRIIKRTQTFEEEK